MKPIFKRAILLAFAVVFMFSCDDDNASPVTQNEVLITADDPVNAVLLSLAANDTGNQNVIDNFSCFDIVLPVTVVADGQQITVNTDADLAQVEAQLSAYAYDDNTLEYVFPIQIVNAQYAQVTITSQEELEALSAGCAQLQAGAECLTVGYPVTFTLYAQGQDIPQEQIVTNDAGLYAFISGLGAASYAVSYPVTVTGYNGEAVVITSNSQLLQVLQAGIQDCAANTCTAYSTPFQQAYDSLKGTSNVHEYFTMDALIHEYTFTMAQAGSICSIGYKAENRPVPINYLIEIIDNNGNIIYSGSHTFSPFFKEYVSIPAVSIAAGQSYTIRRSVSSYNVGLGIGYVLWGANASDNIPILPYSQGDITIQQARYYGGGGSLDPMYYSLPDIDFIFKPL